VNWKIAGWSSINGLLPKSLFTLSKTLLINLRLVPGALKTRPLGSDNSKRLSFTSPRLMRKNALMTVQKDLGNSQLKRDPFNGSKSA
jgi:hypothetical protein